MNDRLVRWAPMASAALAVVAIISAALSVALYVVNRDSVEGVNYLFGDAVAGVLYPCTGAVLLRLRPENRVGWVFAATSVVAVNALANQYAVWSALVRETPAPLGDFAAWLAGWGWAPELLVPVFLPLLFPSGHLPSRRWRPVAAVALAAFAVLVVVLAIGHHPIDASDQVYNPWALTTASWLKAVPAACLLVLVTCMVLALGSLVPRMRRATGAERDQLAWFVLAVVVTILAALATAVLPESVSEIFWTIAVCALPVGVAIALLRHRLLDVDVILNRTVVYGVLTLLILGCYLVAAAALGTIAAQRLGILALAVVALALASARGFMQRTVDKALFGERRDPFAVVNRLGERIDAARNPDEALQDLVDELAASLRLPYAAVRLSNGSREGRTVSTGRAVAGVVETPITVHGDPVAVLEIGRRHRSEVLGDRERALLQDAGRQAGALVQASTLLEQLQESREQIVAAREEERRRLRHDLHDSVGPQLAGLALQLEGLGRRIHDDDDAAARVTRLQDQLRDTVREVRAVVDSLRPPALDDVGLVEALRQQVYGFSDGAGPVETSVQSTGQLPPLPAAVEVAAYRIATEAVTNALRHADASSCRVHVGWEAGWLAVEVSDDGRGMQSDGRGGVGMTSMEERAQEVGGRLEVTSSGQGTTVRALLPVTTA